MADQLQSPTQLPKKNNDKRPVWIVMTLLLLLIGITVIGFFLFNRQPVQEAPIVAPDHAAEEETSYTPTPTIPNLPGTGEGASQSSESILPMISPTQIQ